MTIEAEIRSRGPGFAIGIWHNLVVVAFSTTPSVAAASDMYKIATEQAKEHGRIGMVHVVQTDRGAPPNAEARKYYVDMLRDLNDAFIGAGVVAAGQGFVSSIVRSVIAGFTMVVRLKFSMKVFADIPTCGRWMSEQMSADQDGLTAALDTTVEAIGEI